MTEYTREQQILDDFLIYDHLPKEHRRLLQQAPDGSSATRVYLDWQSGLSLAMIKARIEKRSRKEHQRLMGETIPETKDPWK